MSLNTLNKYEMKKRLLLCILTCAVLAAGAQQKKPALNHIAVYVVNLQRSTAFYKDVIGLDTIPEPFHDGKHTWFQVAAHAHLHIISGAAAPTTHDKNGHLCFSVPSVEAFIETLNRAGVPYE